MSDTLTSVISRIKNTIKGNPKHSYLSSASTSCYAMVAKYLKAHPEPSNVLVLFGVSEDQPYVAHAVLYDKTGNVLVDTFARKGGKIVVRDKKAQYEAGGHTYPMIYHSQVASLL